MKYIIEDKTLIDIADAIRTYDGSESGIDPVEMPQSIKTIVDNNTQLIEQNAELVEKNKQLSEYKTSAESDFDSIKTSITNAGVEVADNTPAADYADKIDEVYEVGKQKEWSDFWDNYQSNGTRRSYANAFYGSGWNDVTFKPKYDIKVNANGNNVTNMFQGAMFTNLKQILETQGVVIDLSLYNGSLALSLFLNCSNLTVVPEFKINTKANFGSMYSGCTSLHTIEGFVLGEEGTQTFSNTFYNCTALENLTITSGKFGRSVSFSTCSKLTVESLKSIITHLVNYTGTDSEFTYTLTLHATSKALLEAEGDTSPNGNSWIAYITDDLKWNLA